ncbi:hypothetical protein OIV83_000431 [Microbotryomycetes sp. JL201]|nr:hypothetical protein OIV83_000431 [Microbotryomycetes sp. JL201]
MADVGTNTVPPPQEAAAEHSLSTNGDAAMTDAAGPADGGASGTEASKNADSSMDAPGEHKRSAREDEGDAEDSRDDDIEVQAAKKRRMAVAADESKKRGKRMFGLLQNTLQQAKKDTGSLAEKNKRRTDIEKRLQDKLMSERQEMEKKREREQESRELKLDVLRKEDELAKAESIYDVRHSVKLSLAHFLCTSFPVPPPQQTNDDIKEAYMPRLPHALRSSHPNAPRPIYYLPYKLLRWQEDRIDDQIDDVKKAIRRDKDAWEDSKMDKVEDLQLAKKKRAERLQDIERAEKEERQKLRREREARGDNKVGSRGRKGQQDEGDDGRDRYVGRDRDGDDDMRDRSRSGSPPRRQTSRSRSRSRARSRSPARHPDDEKKELEVQDVRMQDEAEKPAENGNGAPQPAEG